MLAMLADVSSSETVELEIHLHIHLMYFYIHLFDTCIHLVLFYPNITCNIKADHRERSY